MKGKSLRLFKFSQPAIDGNYNSNIRNGGFEVSMVVTIKTTVFWEVTLHNMVG
jgi:hypothetical protein